MITLQDVINEKVRQDRNNSPTGNRVWFLSSEDFEEMRTLLKDPDYIYTNKIFGFKFIIRIT